jgi:hypothetical protein
MSPVAKWRLADFTFVLIAGGAVEQLFCASTQGDS